MEDTTPHLNLSREGGGEAIAQPAGAVQQGIQRVYDEASSYYRELRWQKTRLTRFEHELTRRTIVEELGEGPVERALELGCGPGTWTGLLADRAASVTAVDLSPGMLEQARWSLPMPHVQFVNADATRFESEQQFDRAISIRVLEYIPEWAEIVSRLGTLVRPGGRVVLVTKTKLSLWRGTGRERWFGPRTMARKLFKRSQKRDFWQRHIPVHAMHRTLTEAGFVDLRVRPVIYGLPIYMRGTMQYPIVPKFAEPALLGATDANWRWVSGRGDGIRRAALLFSESYAISGRRA